MLQARDHIQAALDYAEKTDNTPLTGDLGKALKTMHATTLVEGFDILRLSRRGRTDPARSVAPFRIESLDRHADGSANHRTKERRFAPGKREANSRPSGF